MLLAESKKKNGEILVKGAGLGTEQGVSESVLGEFNKPLVWIDLEMTGAKFLDFMQIYAYIVLIGYLLSLDIAQL